MKPSIAKLIPTITLWTCMIITVVLATILFVALASGFVAGESAEAAALTGWMFILLTVAIVVLVAFAITRIFRNPGRALKPLLFIAGFVMLLLLAWIFGSDRTFEISGYEGNQNTAFWMRLTDMWLLSIAALLCVSSIALLAGIIWSKTKKHE